MTGFQIEMRLPVRELEEAVAALPIRDSAFGNSLLAQLKAKGSLSAKQQPYADAIIAKHKAQQAAAQSPQEPKATEADITLSAFFTLFEAASKSKGVRHPKVTLGRANGTKLVLSLASENSMYPGSINVASDKYGQGTWFGRIVRGEGFKPSNRADDATLAAILDELRLFAKNPMEAAKSHGQRFGFCCFCNRTLTDAVSVANGYGPICAEKFGL